MIILADGFGNFAKSGSLEGQDRGCSFHNTIKKWTQGAEKYILEQAPFLFIYAPSSIMMVQPWAHNVVDNIVQAMDVESTERAWLDKH